MADTRADTPPLDEASAAAGAVACLLHHESELIRSAALRAYARLAPHEQARGALLAALTDEDPDIRSDAMERLATRARPLDAAALMASLRGDPVREVKLAAIEALANIGATDSVDLLRRLALSASEDDVAWEQTGDGWEDWLDIQIAAIAALGRMGASEAIGDILAARADEFAQGLDVAAFNALGMMGADGIGALLHILQTETHADLRCAAAAIASASAESLSPHIDLLLGCPDADVRAMALTALPVGDPRAGRLAASDPSASVRAQALRHAGKADVRLVEAALNDSSEQVQAEALALLHADIAPRLREALAENMLLWLRHAGAGLAAAAARTLPRFAPERCQAPLLELIADAERPLEARIEAVQALAAIAPPVPPDVYAGILTNPAQQVRVAALRQLSRLAEAGERAATQAIVAAIDGAVAQPAARRPDGEAGRDDVAMPNFAMPKGEGGTPQIRITREGDIVEGADPGAQSTLQRIISPPAAADLRPEAEDTPEEQPAKRLKRQPVEGPLDAAASLVLDSMRVCGAVASEGVQQAMLRRAGDDRDEIRQAAWPVIAQWPRQAIGFAAAADAAKSALTDPVPVVRQAALRVLETSGLPAASLQQALRDEDALVRAAAVVHLPAPAALDFMADSSLPVRRAAIGRVAAGDDPQLDETAVGLLLQAGHIDTLGELLRASKNARLHAVAAIPRLEKKQLLVLLEALAKPA